MALFALRKRQSSNAHAQQSTGATRRLFGQTLRLRPYVLCANSEGSGETAWCEVSPEPSLFAPMR